MPKDWFVVVGGEFVDQRDALAADCFDPLHLIARHGDFHFRRAGQFQLDRFGIDVPGLVPAADVAVGDEQRPAVIRNQRKHHFQRDAVLVNTHFENTVVGL